MNRDRRNLLRALVGIPVAIAALPFVALSSPVRRFKCELVSCGSNSLLQKHEFKIARNQLQPGTMIVLPPGTTYEFPNHGGRHGQWITGQRARELEAVGHRHPQRLSGLQAVRLCGHAGCDPRRRHSTADGAGREHTGGGYFFRSRTNCEVVNEQKR